MVDELKEGEVYWTINAVLEGQTSGDETTSPWRGKAACGYHGVLYIHGYDRETGVIDTDSNATAFAEPSRCFDNPIDAWKAYRDEMVVELKNLQGAIGNTDRLIARLISDPLCLD